MRIFFKLTIIIRTRAKQSRMRGEVYINEYDLGSAKNWQIFFGPSRYITLLMYTFPFEKGY